MILVRYLTSLKATEYVVDYSYYLGIIDYQQTYTLRKQVLILDLESSFNTLNRLKIG
jgi:hypothetical protein